MAHRKDRKVKSDILEKQLQEVDKLFYDLEHDKSLPTFGEHFMYCLMFGIARNVDLQALYPRQYKKLSMWLKQHNQRIVAERKRNI